MFASQAALVIANARRHREEQRTRADLETLVNTTPVGVMVFDAKHRRSDAPSTGRRGGSSATCARPAARRSSCWRC